jgi:hypothetical protein
MTSLDIVEQTAWLMMESQSEQICELLKSLPSDQQDDEDNLIRNMAITILTQLALNRQRAENRALKFQPQAN